MLTPGQVVPRTLPTLPTISVRSMATSSDAQLSRRRSLLSLVRPGVLWIVTSASLFLPLLATSPLGATAQGTQPRPVEAVPRLDLDRFMGQWFEIARTPNSHERECARDVVSTYERISDAAVDIASACRHTDGEEERGNVIAHVRDPVSKSKLELRYAPRALGWLPFVWDDYWVLTIAPTYAYALIGEPSRESLWILARTPTLDDATYDELVAVAAAQGFDTGKLARTPQSGRPYALETSP